MTASLRAFPGARLDAATVLADDDWRAANTQEQPDRVVPRAHPDATWLSAGMSGDLEQAVAAGATHLRVGSAVLGSRPPL